MTAISNELYSCDRYIQSFETMREYCSRPENVSREISLFIKVNKDLSSIDMGRYNDAIATDVAVIFNSADGEPPFERNMICFPKNDGVLRHVSVTDSSLDPLAYPLLFPNGDAGWFEGMRHNIVSSSTAASSHNKVTMLCMFSFSYSR